MTQGVKDLLTGVRAFNTLHDPTLHPHSLLSLSPLSSPSLALSLSLSLSALPLDDLLPSSHGHAYHAADLAVANMDTSGGSGSSHGGSGEVCPPPFASGTAS